MTSADGTAVPAGPRSWPGLSATTWPGLPPTSTWVHPPSYPPGSGPAGPPPPGQGFPPSGGYPPPGQGGYGYPGYPGGYDESQGPAGYSGLAIASFVTGLILPLVGILVAVPLGIVALVKISGTRTKGRWMAIAGIVLSVLWWVGVITVGVILATQQAERDSSGAISKEGRIDFGDIRARTTASRSRTSRTTPRSTPSTSRVCPATRRTTPRRSPFSRSPARAYPGQAALDSQASQQCVSAVGAGAGRQHRLPALRLVAQQGHLGRHRRASRAVLRRRQQLRRPDRFAAELTQQRASGAYPQTHAETSGVHERTAVAPSRAVNAT